VWALLPVGRLEQQGEAPPVSAAGEDAERLCSMSPSEAGQLLDRVQRARIGNGRPYSDTDTQTIYTHTHTYIYIYIYTYIYMYIYIYISAAWPERGRAVPRQGSKGDD